MAEPFLYGIADRTAPLPPLRTVNIPSGDPNALTQGDLEAPIPSFVRERPGFITELGRGIGAGWENLGTSLRGLGATGAGLLGFEETALELLKIAQEREEETARRYPSAVQKIEDIESVSDFLYWASRQLGEQVPLLATTVLGGGGLALLGRLAGRGAMSLGVAKSIATKFPFIGFAAPITGIEIGATANELYGVDQVQHPEVALMAGFAKGALESIVPAGLGRMLGLGATPMGGLMQSTIGAFNRVAPGRLGTALGIGATEAVTETLQEAADIAARAYVDKNYDLLGEDARSRLLNSAASGALVGGVLGGAIHRQQRDITKRDSAASPIPPAQPDYVLDAQGRVQPKMSTSDPTDLHNLPLTQGDVDLDKSPSVAPTLGTLSRQVYVEHPGTDGLTNSKFVEFQHPELAQYNLARVEDIRSARIFALDQAEKSDVSTSLESLAPDFKAIDPRVEYVGKPADKLKAQRLLQQAINARNSGGVQRGQADYYSALELGVRIRPQANESFVLIQDTNSPGRGVKETNIDAASAPSVEAYVPRLEWTGREVANGGGERVFKAAGVSSRQTLIPRPDMVQPTYEPQAVKLETLSMLAQSGIKRPTKPAELLDWLRKHVNPRAYITGVGKNEIEIFNFFNQVNALLDSGTYKQPEGQRPLDRMITLMMENGLRLPAQDPSKVTHWVTTAANAHMMEIPSGVAPYDERMDFRKSNDAAYISEMMMKYNTVDHNGAAVYDPAKHEPGTTRLIYDTGAKLTRDDIVKLKNIVRFYDAMLKKFGLKDIKLLVFGNSMLPGLQHFDLKSNPNLYGLYHPIQGLDIIGLNMMAMRRDEFLFNVAAHEFGHFLSYTALQKLGPSILRKLHSAYNRARIRAAFGDNKDFINAFRSLPNSGNFDRGEFEGQNILDITDMSNYFLSFDEWIAENVARIMSGEMSNFMDPIESFFHSVAQKLRQLYASAKQWFRMSSEPEVYEWLRMLQRQGRDEAIQQEAEAQNGFPLPMHAGMEEGLRENAELTRDLLNSESPAPPTGPTYSMGEVFRKVGLPTRVGKKIRALADKYNWFMDLFFNLQQISQANPHLWHLQRYTEYTDQWNNFRLNWIARADQRVRQWNSIGRAQKKALTSFIYDMDAMEYLTPQEKKNGAARLPTDPEMAAFARKHGLTELSLEVYQGIRQDFNDVLTQIEQTSMRDAERLYTDPAILMLEQGKIREEMSKLRARPYFPHARFGSHVVVAKIGTRTIYMEQFEGKPLADSAAPAIAKKYPTAKVYVDKIPDEVMAFRGLPPSLLKNIRDRLQLTDVQKYWLEDMMVEMAPSASFRKHLAKRENIPGYSLDTMRAYASYFFHGANHLARIEYKPLMDEVINEFSKSIRELGVVGTPTDVSKRRRIKDYMSNHLEHIMNPKPDWAGLRSIAFQWYLGFNVSSAMLNMTQVPFVAYPYLAARFGDANAIGAFKRAVFDIQNIYKYKEQDRVSDELLKALDRGVKHGVLDESQATELATAANGGMWMNKLLSGTKLEKFVQEMGYWSGWMFQQTERMNRRIVFRAAWDLTMKRPQGKYMQELMEQNQLEMEALLSDGFSHTEALAYLAGRDAVRRTQFQYASHARPKFMRGKKGVVFTFFMFTQSMLHFTLFSPGNTRYLVIMLAMAGLMGLPGAEDLSAIAKFLARNLLGVDFDVEKEVRELIVGMAGDKISPDLFLHGLGRVGFGMPAMMEMMGLPKPSFDVSRRIGFGRIIPGVADLGPPGLEFDQAFSKITTDAAGATFGIGFNILKAMQDDSLPLDDFKRWERAMPAIMRNIGRTLRFATEGRERSRTGATVTDFDMTDPDHIGEAFGVALGLQPTRLAREWDRIKMQQEAEKYWLTRRSFAMKMYNQALLTKDPEMRGTALDSVRRYNESVPFGVMKITPDQLKKSAETAAKARRMREAGISTNKSLRPLGREIGSLFPETGKIYQPQSSMEDVEDVTRLR